MAVFDHSSHTSGKMDTSHCPQRPGDQLYDNAIGRVTGVGFTPVKFLSLTSTNKIGIYRLCWGGNLLIGGEADIEVFIGEKL